MRSEAEIRRKLKYYESILIGMEAGRMVDIAAIFLQLLELHSEKATAMLKTLSEGEKFIRESPPEDRSWIRYGLQDSFLHYARETLRNRMVILRWVLEMEPDSGWPEGGGGAPD